MRRLLFALVMCACQREGSRPRGLPAVGPALRAAIGDVDGDGLGEIAVADAGRLRLLDRSGGELAALPAPGGAQAMLIADLDGDGRGEVAAGWGRDRAHPDASARVSLYRLERGALVEEVVAAPASERPEIAALLAEPPDLFVAWYDSKYVVKSAHARRAGDAWRLDEVAAIRSAGSYALGDVDGDGARDLVVGRYYGDEVASDGDAFLLRPDGTRVAIPTTRGVHALAVIDGDLFLADGWDKDYGRIARALVTRSRWTGGAFRSELIDDVAGEHSIRSLVAADLDGDGRAELAARGSGSVWIYTRADGGWRGRRVAGAASDLAAGSIDGAPGDELLVVGAGGSTWIGRGR
jgi:hypothetical protein